MEYTGTRMKHDDADNLYSERPYTYLFGVGDGTYVIDGYGMAMYLNHSCAPNCETEEDEDERVWIRAIRDIEAGRRTGLRLLPLRRRGRCTLQLRR